MVLILNHQVGTRHRFLELGRSCVLKPYRTKRTVELTDVPLNTTITVEEPSQ